LFIKEPFYIITDNESFSTMKINPVDIGLSFCNQCSHATIEISSIVYIIIQ
jgi:hypothetical protein